MTSYEYRVIPAPRQGLKARGVKGTEAMFAHALTTLLNEAAAEGWEYVRAETLPCEAQGRGRTQTMTYQNILVFRRPTAQALATAQETTRAAAAAAPVERAAPVPPPSGLERPDFLPPEPKLPPRVPPVAPVAAPPSADAPKVLTPDLRTQGKADG